MRNILSIQTLPAAVKRVKKSKQSIVLAGGCFDLIHPGHIRFLEEARKQADVLFILLESDMKIESLKGENRPVFAQKDRALVLISLKFVDFVVLLPNLMHDGDYDRLIELISPNIIATTKGDPMISHKIRQAKKVNAKLKEVIDNLGYSSTKFISKLLFSKTSY